MMSDYHYQGKLQLYESCKYPRFSDLRIPCKIVDRYFDCLLILVGRESLNPGESGEVQVTFLCIDLVSQLLQVGGCYEVCEGSVPIGEICITRDWWIDLSALIVVGEVMQAKIISTWGTVVGISLVLDGGMSTQLMSEAIGRTEWERKIGQVLNHGDIVKVRVEKIDEVSRKIKVSLIEKVIC